MKWCSPRENKIDRDAIEMLDQPRSKKRRQLRRLRNKRVRGEIDRGADSAIMIVLIIAGLLPGNGLQYLRSRASDIDRRGGATNAVYMDVPESQDEL